jgi:hypothetical protein
MPEDDPDKVNAAEARQIADYITEAFYSPRAQARIKPPRVDLSRLTVRQYRQSVADLVSEFTGNPVDKRQEGLSATYFDGRFFDGKKKVEDRIDPDVDFQWTKEGPLPGKLDPKQFAVRWSGGVLAPATGWYELTIRTGGAVRVWFNQMWPQAPLIDAGVQSGDSNVFQESIYLVEGRIYPIQVDYSQAFQGVNDEKQQKKNRLGEAKPAFFTLAWRTPGSSVAVPISRRFLSTGWAPEVLAISTSFPPDDRSTGWERGTTVSKAWDAAATDAALEAARYIAKKLNSLAGIKKEETDRRAKVEKFAKRFVELAFRRPLTPQLQAVFVQPHLATDDFEQGIQRLVLLTLKSPRFLYREVGGTTPDGFDIASRLSYALWDSFPDAELRRAAGANELKNPENLRRQAERMIQNPRAKAKYADFYRTWLKMDQATDMVKDPNKFPGFDAHVVADLQESLERTLEEITWSSKPDFRQLLTTQDLWLNGRLSKFYAPKPLADKTFQKVPVSDQPRAGVLTHPYLMAMFAHGHSSSPIHRGVFVARNVLGINLRPPQEAIAPVSEDLHPTLTTRERVALQTGAVACATCHTVINPLGFALESFDAVGRYRLRDNNKPIDASGEYRDADGKVIPFSGPRDLGLYLAKSPEAHEAFAEHLFHHLVKQPVRAYGVDTLDALRKRFSQSEYNLQKLAVEIAVTAASPPPTVPQRKVAQAP